MAAVDRILPVDTLISPALIHDILKTIDCKYNPVNKPFVSQPSAPPSDTLSVSPQHNLGEEGQTQNLLPSTNGIESDSKREADRGAQQLFNSQREIIASTLRSLTSEYADDKDRVSNFYIGIKLYLDHLKNIVKRLKKNKATFLSAASGRTSDQLLTQYSSMGSHKLCTETMVRNFVDLIFSDFSESDAINLNSAILSHKRAFDTILKNININQYSDLEQYLEACINCFSELIKYETNILTSIRDASPNHIDDLLSHVRQYQELDNMKCLIYLHMACCQLPVNFFQGLGCVAFDVTKCAICTPLYLAFCGWCEYIDEKDEPCATDCKGCWRTWGPCKISHTYNFFKNGSNCGDFGSQNEDPAPCIQPSNFVNKRKSDLAQELQLTRPQLQRMQ